MKWGRPYEIAIIGMGCHFPGSSDLVSFFENILSARDCTSEVPSDRWDSRRFCDPGSAANDRVPSCRGGYLQSPVRFAAAGHGVMPLTVEGGEPEQFLILDTAMAALADAGLTIESLKGTRVEVVIGRGNYFNRGNLTRLQHGRMIDQTITVLAAFHPEWSEAQLDQVRADLRRGLPAFEAATIPGQLTNATAGRLAHRLDLSGASFVVDAASASSLVAVDLAARALLERRARIAIAGGVYFEADVDFPLVFRQLNALSRSGVARPFASDADGMIPGEGAGVLILKRRADAERDGDRIYAVIQNVGLASDGKSQGLAAPSARGHARAISRAYRGAGINPNTVMLVEGHGLGVPAADRAELRALNAIFPALAHGHRTLGAVSSMIGHAMPASGMAGLIKTALALYHRVLPPSLHTEKPHPLLAADKSSFALNAKARPWIHSDEITPRRAGVNAFGFAGINAHAVLEEHSQSADSDRPGALQRWDTEAILLSAPDRDGLIERIDELLHWLKNNPEHSLLDVAYSLNSRREHSPKSARLGVVVSSLPDLIERLTPLPGRLRDPACHFLHDRRGVYFWDKPLLDTNPQGLAFLFPGEGSQYAGMLADLCIHFPEVRHFFDTADRIAHDLGMMQSPSEHLFGDASGGEEGLWSTATAVNVVLNAQWALYQLLCRLGLRPNAVVGHSSGEILALSAGGVFETDRALQRKLGHLGTIMSGLVSSGDVPVARLVAAAAPRDRLESLCRDLGASDVDVAMDNCPHQVVLAIPAADHVRVIERLRRENILFEELPFSRAYHTPSFRPVIGPIVEFFDQMDFRAPSIPIYSCASGGRMPGSPAAIRELAIAQWTQTVAFRETIESMHHDGLRVFIDVGARGNLAGFVEDTLRGRPSFTVAANLPRRTGLTQLNHLVASTFAHGARLKTDYLYARRRPLEIDWKAPKPTPTPTVELKIGFPAMRPSAALVEQLGSAAHRASPFEPALCDVVSNHFADDGGEQFERGERDHDVRLNGFSRHGHGPIPMMTVADLTSHQQRFTIDVEAASVQVPDSWTLPDQGAESIQPSVNGSAADDHAMLLFQDTMRSFLQTQHEVMTTYLAVTAPEAERPGERPMRVLADASSHYSNGKVEAPHERNGDDGAVHDQAVTGHSTPEHRGPWGGEVRRLVPGVEIETLLKIEAHDDPVGQHHTLGGRKISALDPSLLGLPVVPFAVMVEMTAQVAAMVAPDDLILTGVKGVRAHKWVRYEDEPVHLELRGYRVSSTDDVRVWVGIYNRGIGGRTDAPRPVFEAVAVFGDARGDAPPASAFALENARPSKFTARSVYDEQWLFHGPYFQAIAHMGQLSKRGIEGRLRVLPLEPLLKAGQHAANFHTDLVVIDNFTQLLGAWGLDYLAEGNVMFPLHMEDLEIFGTRPAVGTEIDCQITIHELERYRIRVEAQFVRPDGTVWMRIHDWEDWRFHWPNRYRDSFRQPRDYMIGEELLLEDPDAGPISGVKAVWLEPPADMGRPIWRDVLEFTQLGPDERNEFLATKTSEQHRSQTLWGRIAAKEAARRLWKEMGHPGTYPADLAIATDQDGPPRLLKVGQPAEKTLPAIAIAHTEGVAVALAAIDSEAHVGIAVELVVDRPENVQQSAFNPSERASLDRIAGSSRSEWISRFRCAKKAAAGAWGRHSANESAGVEVIGFNEARGVIHVRVGRSTLESPTASNGETVLRVISVRRSDRVWAWTTGKGMNL